MRLTSLASASHCASRSEPGPNPIFIAPLTTMHQQHSRKHILHSRELLAGLDRYRYKLDQYRISWGDPARDLPGFVDLV
jgi:hypothetical protein